MAKNKNGAVQKTRKLLPDFADSDCQYFTACGLMKSVGDETDAWLRGVPAFNRPMVAAYNSSKGRAYARLRVSKTKGEQSYHLHVDIALRRRFKKTPKATHKRKDLEAILSGLDGQSITVSLSGLYSISKERLARKSLIHNACSLEWRAGSFAARPSGLDLSYEDDRIASYQWKFDGNFPSIVVKTVDFPERLSEKYLLGVFHVLDVLFKVAVSDPKEELGVDEYSATTRKSTT